MLARSFLTSTLGLLPLLAASLLSGAAQATPADSLTLTPRQARFTNVAAAPTAPEPVLTNIQPGSENLVGIVKSVNGGQVEIKLPDGQTKFYTAPASFETSSLDRGSFVEVVLDANQAIQEIKIPPVQNVISGVISKIDGENVTLELADGTQQATVINPETAQRMNLTPGVPLTVTSYTGLTATKLCPTLLATCCQKPAAPLPVPPQVFRGGGELPKVVPQKW